MNEFRRNRSPVERKLRRVVMLTSLVALLLAVGTFVTYDVLSFRAELDRDLNTLADIAGASSTAALAFEDRAVAEEVLATLSSNPCIVSAAIFRPDGGTFATYARDGGEPGINPEAGEGGLIDGHVVRSRPIEIRGEVLGRLYIKSDLYGLYSRLRSYGLALAGVLAASLLLATILSSRLHRVITRPILSLAEAAQIVSEERDYTVRVTAKAGDELAVLCEAFNDMLSQIEVRDAALQEAHDELENLVRERTAELNHQVNERKQAESALQERESQLRQSLKMEAVGRLAGGIAHDFNNLLTAIMGYTALMLMRLDPQDPLHGQAEEIQKAGARASNLTRQLLAFSRKQVLEPRILELNEVVTNMEKMLRRLIGEKIELIAVQTPDLGRIAADPGQIEQVVMNLCVNARDAMPQGGRLTIEAANVELLQGAERPHAGMEPGAYVVLQISDTGVGMDEETRTHMFEPFYTTKDMGKGTGLGLSTVYGIVRQSGGFICVDSAPSRGTTFRIYFSRVEAEALDMPEKGAALPVDGCETILLVEDEEMVRELAREILEMNGYNVIEAPHGGEALSLCGSYAETIHMMVTDVVMPELNGRELYEKLSPLRPDMKVLYMSGYTDDAIDREGVLDPGTAFLQKPFTPVDLARKVRSVLDG